MVHATHAFRGLPRRAIRGSRNWLSVQEASSGGGHRQPDWPAVTRGGISLGSSRVGPPLAWHVNIYTCQRILIQNRLFMQSQHNSGHVAMRAGSIPARSTILLDAPAPLIGYNGAN